MQRRRALSAHFQRWRIYNAKYLDDLGGIGFGIGGKTKGLGKHVVLSDTSNNYNNSSIAYATDLSLPLKSGGSWALWVEFSGTTAIDENAGSYTVCNGAEARKDASSIIAQTKKLMQQLSAQRRAAAAAK